MPKKPSNEHIIRSTPYNNDAEIYVLGSIIIDNRIINRIIGKLIEEDFYDERHQWIFKAMINLNNRNEKIDIISILEELSRININPTEELRLYLIDMVDAVPATSNIQLYIDIVEEKAIERSLLDKMGEISDNIRSNTIDFNGILEKTEDVVMDIVKRRRTSSVVTMAKAANDVYGTIVKASGNASMITGLETGYHNLDTITLGLQKGDLMILAARPSVGKSSYAINLALNTCEKNPDKTVALFSLEMSIEQIMMRVYSYKADIELSKIRSGSIKQDDLLLLGLAKERLQGLNLYFDDSNSTNLADIRTKCRQLHQAGKLDFVIIDYLQLITMTDNRANRQEEVAKISRALKTLARELEVPILALSQLSRGIESREDKTPSLSDLRESGSLEQDADMVMFLARRSDVEYQEPSPSEQKDIDEGKTSPVMPTKEKPKIEDMLLYIAKNRQGPLGIIDYHFYGAVCKFVEQKEHREIVPKKKSTRMKKLN